LLFWKTRKIQPRIKESPPSGVIKPMVETGNPVNEAVPIINREPENIMLPKTKARPAIRSCLEPGCCFERRQTNKVARVWMKS